MKSKWLTNKCRKNKIDEMADIYVSQESVRMDGVLWTHNWTKLVEEVQFDEK